MKKKTLLMCVEEARAWISECIGEQLPAASHLEDNFRYDTTYLSANNITHG